MHSTSGMRSTIQALSAIFWKGIKHYTRYPGNLILLVVLPFLFTLMIFGMGQFVGGADAAQNFAERTGTTNIIVYEILGSAVWMISWVVVEDVGVVLRDEQMKGTLEQNFLAPVNRFTLLIGMSLTDVVITTALFFAVFFAVVFAVAAFFLFEGEVLAAFLRRFSAIPLPPSPRSPPPISSHFACMDGAPAPFNAS